MRFVLALTLTVAGGPTVLAQADTHHYSKADRYGGCLVGYLIPALRRGNSQTRAMAMAEDRCLPLSEGLSDRDLGHVVDQVNFWVAVTER